MLQPDNVKYINDIARSLARNKEEAEDIAQDALVTINAKLDTFKDDSSLNTWMYRIVKNKFINSLVRNQVKINAEGKIPEGIEDSSENELLKKELSDRVLSSISSLSEVDGKIVSLRFFNNKSYLEISESTGLPTGTIKSKLNRIKSKMKEDLLEV